MLDTQTLARVFLLVVLLVFFWWFVLRKNRQKGIPVFQGLQEYKVDTSLVEDAIGFFNPYAKKKSPRRYDKTEKECRKILEQHFQAEFPSARPDFLKSPVTKKNLELDCYNPDLQLALEYNGKQHYTYTPHFHKSKKDFYSQVHRDDWKRKRCRELGIKLIEVPYWITIPKLKNYILKQIRNL